MLRQRLRLIKESKLLENLTKQILINDFEKSEADAETMIKEFNIKSYVWKHPILLQDSPYDWVLRLLTRNKDIKALEKAI